MDLNDDIKKDLKGDILNIPLEDNHCDNIICTHVIEHIAPELISVAFKELYRVLKPKGSLILSLPNCKESINKPFLERSANICGGARWEHDTHRSVFFPEDIAEEGIRAGFTVYQTLNKEHWFDRRHDKHCNMEFNLIKEDDKND